MAKKFSFRNAKTLIEETLSLRYYSDPDPAIPNTWSPGNPSSPLAVVTGENASGKSFFRRCISSVCREVGVECMPISMEGRRSISSNIGLALVYGSEEYDATGINSIRTVLTGIRTSQGRETPHVIVWDEPDLGLSDGNAASVGKAIADFAASPPPTLLASIVITHRKALVGPLETVRPHFLYLGGPGPSTIDQWLTAPPVIRPLDEVQEEARVRFRAIQKILNTIKTRRR